MRGAAAAAVAAAGLLLAGCGGESRREAFDAYLERVNVAQAAVVAEAPTFNQALRNLATPQGTRRDLKALQRARKSLRAARARVSAVEPPAEAQGLHRDVLRLLDLEAALADELAATAVYLPRLGRAQRPLAAAQGKLLTALRRARDFPTLEPAFVRYRRSLTGVLAELERLDAPPALAPALRAQRRAVRQSIAIARQIESALRRRDRRALERGVRRLAALAGGREAARTRAAAAAAVRAYNARVRRVADIAGRIERERQRLAAELR